MAGVARASASRSVGVFCRRFFACVDCRAGLDEVTETLHARD